MYTCRYIHLCTYMYIYVCTSAYMHICTLCACIYIKYCIATIHATKPQATSAIGNRAKGNHSYRQPVWIHRRFHRQTVHRQPVHRQLSHRQPVIKANEPQATDPTGNQSCKAPGSPSALFSNESEGSLMQTLFNPVQFSYSKHRLD